MEKNTHNGSRTFGSIWRMRLDNFAREIIWLAVLAACYFAIWSKVAEQYRLIGSVGSIREFQSNILYGLVYIAALSILWWLSATNEWDQGAAFRNFFEQYNSLCALIFDFLAVVGIFLIHIFCGSRGIYAPNGYFYPLNCIYMLPAAFICIMYAFPPVNVKEVILIGKGRRHLIYRVLLSIVAAAIAVAFFVLNFFDIGR